MNENRQIKGSHNLFFGYTKVNLYILVASLVLIAVGYTLMSGGSSADGVSFNEEVFNSTRIVIAPIICTLGYFGVVAAIVYKGRRK